MSVYLDTGCCCSDKRIGWCTESHDYCINVKLKFTALDFDRSASAGSIGLTELHFDTFHWFNRTCTVVIDFYRIVKKKEFNAFFLCMMDFFVSCRHFFFGTSVNNVYMLCTESFCTSCGVHGNITASDNCNASAVLDRCIIFFSVSLHKVDSCEVFVCRINTGKILAFDTHEWRKACTCSDKYGIEAHIVDKLVDCENTADNHVCFNLNATGNKSVYFVLNDFLGKSEFGNTVYKNASRNMECFENSYLIAFFCKIACTSETWRTWADNSHIFAV